VALPKVVHFYHAWLENQAWSEIFGEHLHHLMRGSFDGPICIGLIGAPAEQEALKLITKTAGFTASYVSHTGNEGNQWEHGTLELVRNYSIANPDDIVMYAHTKGAHEHNDLNTAWRYTMDLAVCERWRSNRNALYYAGYDAIGTHWLTPEEWASRIGTNFGSYPFFGGNFWMAKCSYLATLDPLIPSKDRFDAERWVGTKYPSVINMIEGWPGWKTFIPMDEEPQDI
jgi:hypothetical protein